MLDQLREFFVRIGSTDPDARYGVDDDPRVAAAALLFHVGNADGVMRPEEAAKLRVLLMEEYGLDPAEVDRVADAGRRADAESVDLYRFTRVLLAHADAQERIRFVELLWEMTYADGTLHELEDNLIWRISELLGVSARDRMTGKRDALARAGR